MSAECKSDLQFEIAHVLFIDAVGYSKLLIDEQKELQQQLNEIVRSTKQFRAAEAENRLIRLPAGDGMALIFFGSPEAPVQCALEINEALRSYPHLEVRMGINTGPVSGVADVNDRSNVAGPGINVAQRVMALGDAGHILLSKRTAEDLVPYRRWQPHLHDLGEFEAKHGQKVSIVNLYTQEIGNPHLPKKLIEETRKQIGNRRRRRLLIVATLFLMISALIAGMMLLTRKRIEGTAPIPEKSIAVLPFENRSEEKANAYFADGIQDEILTRLAKLSDLKVISRTSSEHYRSTRENLRDIAKQLGVAHIVEGSVQKNGEAVRVNVQLINALTDVHVWADTFDRKLTDIFSVESDVATAIADQLQAKLTGPEEQALKSIPTGNSEAYDLYLRARYSLNKRTAESLRRAEALFKQVVSKDPHFAMGHAGLADTYILLAGYGEISSEDASRMAWPEVLSALKIDDALCEGHVARANLLAHFDWNWPAAGAEYRKAVELNPNDVTARHWYALHLAELGHFDEALDQIGAAQRLDPLSPIIRAAKGKILFVAGHYDQALEQCRAALDLEPNFGPALIIIWQTYTAQGRFREAIDVITKYAAVSGRDSSLSLAYVYAASAQKQKAEQIIEKVTSSPDPFSKSYTLTTIYAAMHDDSSALHWLEIALDRDSLSIVWARVDPHLDNIRANPRFRELIARLVPRESHPN